MIRDLGELASLAQFEEIAERTWTRAARGMVQLGAGDGAAIDANRRGFQNWALRSRVLRDVSRIDLATTVLGSPVSMPILVGASGLQSLSHPDGEVATAHATLAADTAMVLSSGTSRPIDEVAAVGAPYWFQLYWGRDRDRVAGIVQMAQDQGARAIVVTVDMPVPSVLGREMRYAVAHIEGTPLYVLPRDGQLRGGEWDHDASLTWADLAWLRSITSLPIVLKGIMTGEDAALAVEHGIAGIIVSNHGGRALDTPRATIDALPEVAEAVAGSGIEVYLDGGVRTGSDIAVALGLGARAVLLGRPITWGLATAGADGVVAVLDLVRRQLTSVMGMLGAPRITDLVRSHVTRAS